MKIENHTLFLQEKLDKKKVPDLLKKIEKTDISRINSIDLSELEYIDSAGVAFLDTIAEKLNNPDLKNIPPQVQSSIDTFSSKDVEKIRRPKPNNLIIVLGEYYFKIKAAMIDFLYLASEIFFWSFISIFNRKGQRKNAIIQQSLLIGVDAVGIISLLSLILGLILALQSATQLRQFGANIFVADLISISMVREMGPMMTAIILAGRSGSSIASEIATMKVTEEIDALKMMAINPLRYIVVPKFDAITICMPLLVTISMLIGIFGGLIIGITYLDLSVTAFINQVIKVLTVTDVLVGLSKSIFFAWVIVIIGSYYGFNVEGGAEGVGKVTTSSVVASIFAVIVLDAIFSFIYL